MSKKKINIIVIIIFVSFVIFLFNYCLKREKAINLAKSYLDQKYEFDVVYNNCRFSFIDPSQYTITFSANNLLFEVIISSDLKNPQDVIKEDYIYVADNYLLNRFKFLMNDYLKVSTDGQFQGFIGVKNQPIYSFKNSRFIKKDMNLNDLENLMEYDLYIEFSNTVLAEKTKNIYDTIQVVKDNKFTPQSIIICVEKNGLTDFIHIDNWSKFNSYADFLSFISSYNMDIN